MAATSQQKGQEEHKPQNNTTPSAPHQKNVDKAGQKERESKEKERANYWDRITDDPASGYGADRNTDNDTLTQDSSTD